MALDDNKPHRENDPATSRRTISWSEINLLLDAALLVTFAAIFAVSVIVRFIFPPGPAANGWILWGLDYDAWSGVQFILLAGLTLGILVHVMLHWSWVCNVLAARIGGRKARVDDGMQTIYGVGLLILLLALVGAAAAGAKLMIVGPA